MNETRHLEETIQALRLENSKLREALDLAVNKQHVGDCEFNDKTGEGCWLCAKATRYNWPVIQAALSRTDLSDKTMTPDPNSSFASSSAKAEKNKNL